MKPIVIFIISILTKNTLLEKADSLYNSLEFHKARIFYLKAAQETENPEEKFKIFLKLSDIEFLMKNNEKAIFYLKKIIKTNNKNKRMDEVFYELGVLYEISKEPDSASKYYQRVITGFKNSKYKKSSEEALERIFQKKIEEYVGYADGIKITKLEYENYIERLPPSKRPKNREEKKKIIIELLKKKIILLEAIKNGLIWDSEYIKKTRKKEEENLIRLFYKRMADTIKISEQEIKNYYNENIEKFKESEKFDFIRIEVRNKNLARDILKMIKKGAKIDSLAKIYSVSKDAEKGGFIKNYTGKKPPFEYYNFLKGMREGEIKGPIYFKNRDVYAVFKLIKEYKPRIKKFEEVKDEISNILKMKKFMEIRKNYENKILKRYKLKVLVK